MDAEEAVDELNEMVEGASTALTVLFTKVTAQAAAVGDLCREMDRHGAFLDAWTQLLERGAAAASAAGAGAQPPRASQQ